MKKNILYLCLSLLIIYPNCNKKEGVAAENHHETDSSSDVTINLNADSLSRVFQGLGSIASYAKFLYDYPEQERKNILDYLFLPNYGAALQILKVEIGYDGNNTSVSWPSFRRTLDEQPDYQRSCVWWLMQQAKARNPNIKIAGLNWGYPAWATTPELKAEFIYEFVKGAKDIYNINVDYIGGNQNESVITPNVTIALRQKLTAGGFNNVKIITADEGSRKSRFQVLDNLASNPTYASAVDIIGVHYKSRGPNDPILADAFGFGKPVWSSEDGGGGYVSANAGYNWVKQIMKLLLDVKIQGIISWPMVTSPYDNMRWANAGMIGVKSPWSGYYQIGTGLWATAHFTQFIKPGWYIMHTEKTYIYENAEGEESGRFIAFKDPNSGNYSMVINTNDKSFPESGVGIKINLSEGLSDNKIRVWRSDFSKSKASWFVQQQAVTPKSGTISIRLDKGCIYTLSTTTGQGKGTASIPIRHSFPFPYKQDFDNTELEELPKYFININSTFETVKSDDQTGNVLRQSIRIAPRQWHLNNTKVTQPLTEIGEMGWKNYQVRVDAKLKDKGAIILGGRFIGHKINSGDFFLEGYWLSLDDTGKWKLLRKDASPSFVTLASGTLKNFGLNQWIKLGLSMKGNVIKAYIGGEKLAEVTDGTYNSGNVVLGTLDKDVINFFTPTSTYAVADFDNLEIASPSD